MSRCGLLLLMAAAGGAALAMPGCSAYRLYWGDLHGHTGASDGRGTVEEYLRHGRDEAHLDFLAVTDHDFGSGPPWALPQQAWDEMQQAVEAFTIDRRFIAIAGYEWTSQAKYWSGYRGPGASEHLFNGLPKHYSHKNVLFAVPVPGYFSAKDAAYKDPDSLARAVEACGGLIQNNHPGLGEECRDQWDYDLRSAEVIRNTEIGPDVVWYEGRRYEIGTESAIRRYLDRGGRTGLLCSSDTHEGRPKARVAVYGRSLTREAIFEGLRSRRCYGVTGARIVLDFRINRRWMGEEIETARKPLVEVRVRAPHPIATVEIVRNGEVLAAFEPHARQARVRFRDETFEGNSYYYTRVTLTHCDEHGNPARAWSSPIWVQPTQGR